MFARHEETSGLRPEREINKREEKKPWLTLWMKSLLSPLSISQPHVIKMTYHRRTSLKLNQMGGNTVPSSVLRKSDYKTFFCPHVVCLPFLLPLWIWRKSSGRQAHRFSLIVHGGPHRVSMWVCGHAAGRMSVCDSRCLVGGDGVCLHVRVWEEWSLLPTGFSNWKE